MVVHSAAFISEQSQYKIFHYERLTVYSNIIFVDWSSSKRY